MYKRVKCGVAVLCLIALLLTFVLFLGLDSASACEIKQLTDTAYADILRTQTEVPADALKGECRINGVSVPYDKASNTYYVPQSMESSGYDGVLTWKNLSRTAYFCPDELYADKRSAVASGHAFTILVTNGKTYFLANLIFTGLPVVTLRRNDAVHKTDSDTSIAAELKLFDPDCADKNDYTISESVVTYRTRGQTSRYYAKKSYRVTCYKNNGKRSRPSFLDLGSTDEWVLLSLYKDSSRVRDKVSQDLWNTLCDMNPASNIKTDRMRFVELFIEDEYQGLYGLVLPMAAPENIDKENCITLYKNEYSVFYNDLGRWRQDLPYFPDSAEIKWPQHGTDPALWDPLYRYFEAFATVPCAASYETLAGMLDLSNSIDFTLFLQATAASDQRFRNNYYTLRSDGTFTKTPFDLTTTFGYSLYDEEAIESGKPLMEHAVSDFLYFDMRVLIDSDPEAVVSLLCKRWDELSKSLFCAETLKNEFARQMSVITQSGALARDGARWPEFPVSDNLSDIYAFINIRTEYMDEYMSRLGAMVR